MTVLNKIRNADFYDDICTLTQNSMAEFSANNPVPKHLRFKGISVSRVSADGRAAAAFYMQEIISRMREAACAGERGTQLSLYALRVIPSHLEEYVVEPMLAEAFLEGFLKEVRAKLGTKFHLFLGRNTDAPYRRKYIYQLDLCIGWGA